MLQAGVPPSWSSEVETSRAIPAHDLDPISAIGSGAVHEKHRTALEAIIEKLNERFGDKYAPGAVDLYAELSKALPAMLYEFLKGQAE